MVSLEKVQNLKDFNLQVQNLTPRVGSLGGRYFLDTKGKSYSLNKVIQLFQKIQAKNRSLEEEKSFQVSLVEDAREILSKLKELDTKGNQILKEHSEKHTLIVRKFFETGTHLKQFFGGLLFNREKELSNLENKLTSWQEELDCYDERIIKIEEMSQVEKELPKDGFIIKANENHCYIQIPNLEKIAEQKRGLLYSDDLEGFGSIRYLEHATTLENLKKILESGNLLPRNNVGQQGNLGNGDGDGDFIYTQAITKLTERYSFDLKNRNIVYDKNLPDENSEERVLLILDRSLLQRQDLTVAGSWNYGPFFHGPTYFGPEVRENPKFAKIPKNRIIPSLHQAVQKIEKNTFLPNEVCFQNSIDLKKYLVKIVLPKKDEEIIELVNKKDYGFSPEIQKVNEVFLHRAARFFSPI